VAAYKVRSTDPITVRSPSNGAEVYTGTMVKTSTLA
jgi:hypothetical protein